MRRSSFLPYYGDTFPGANFEVEVPEYNGVWASGVCKSNVGERYGSSKIQRPATLNFMRTTGQGVESQHTSCRILAIAYLGNCREVRHPRESN